MKRLVLAALVLGCTRASEPAATPAPSPATTRAPLPLVAPAHVDVTPAIEKAFGVKCDSAEALCPKLAPIGFSRSSAFAYATEPPDEACGCWFHHVVAQYLTTDKIVFETKGNTPLEGGASGPTNLPELWKAKPEIVAKLEELGIEPATLALKPFPAGDVRLEVKKERADSDWGVRVVDRLTIELASSKGKKTILDRTVDNSEFPALVDANVLGYFQSPHEPRISVVLATMGRGYEGPPHPIRIEIVGADIANGFR